MYSKRIRLLVDGSMPVNPVWSAEQEPQMVLETPSNELEAAVQNIDTPESALSHLRHISR